MKTFFIKLLEDNIRYSTKNLGFFILQAQNLNDAFDIIDAMFFDIDKDDIKEIDGSLFNFGGEQ